MSGIDLRSVIAGRETFISRHAKRSTLLAKKMKFMALISRQQLMKKYFWMKDRKNKFISTDLKWCFAYRVTFISRPT